MVTNMDIDTAIDMDVDVADDSPCFNGPVWSGSNIFDLLIWIQPIFHNSIYIRKNGSKNNLKS
jgi:hypothetical protein